MGCLHWLTYTRYSCTKMNFTKTLLLCDDDIEVFVDVKSRGGERSSLAVIATNLLYGYIHTIEENGLCVC